MTVARVSDKEKNIAQDAQQYLAFSLGDEIFATTLLDVREIIEFGIITKIPTMPEFIKGVINLRGRVVPVMDLAVRFGEQSTQINERTCVIIIELNRPDGRDINMGLVVDSVNAVLKIDPTTIEPAPSFGTHIRLDFIRGMWKWQEKFAILLDLEKVLSIEEIKQFVVHLQESDAVANG